MNLHRRNIQSATKYWQDEFGILTIDAATAWPFYVDEPVLILPYYGEYGHFINSFIRQVHYVQAPNKVVCCRPGEEIYFPSATAYYHDWRDVISPDDRVGYRDRWPPTIDFLPTEAEIQLFARLRTAFPAHRMTLIAEPLEDSQVRKMSLQIGPKFTGLPRFDIAVCCRQRRWDSYRNFQRWPEILAPLASEGFTIAAVGQAESSFDFDFFHFRSWDYDPLPEAVVHLISTSRLFIGTDTGPSHLAALISPTVLVFRNETCPYKNYLQDVLTPVAKDRGILFQYVIDGWQRPGRVSQVAREFLALQ